MNRPFFLHLEKKSTMYEDEYLDENHFYFVHNGVLDQKLEKKLVEIDKKYKLSFFNRLSKNKRTMYCLVHYDSFDIFINWILERHTIKNDKFIFPRNIFDNYPFEIIDYEVNFYSIIKKYEPYKNLYGFDKIVKMIEESYQITKNELMIYMRKNYKKEITIDEDI